MAGRKKGAPKTGGRQKGVTNKTTKNAREAIASFVDGNAERLSYWLDEIYHQDGAKDAFKCFSDLLEYHVPKLARHELTGKDGGEIDFRISNAADSLRAKLDS